MSAWLVRQQGSPTAISVPSAADVLTGMRDGNWLLTDEVKGPSDTKYLPIEQHPVFAEAAQDVPEAKPPEQDTHLDMNPLIDVCLVLLIFFILTITYATLERSIDIPADTPEKKDNTPTIQYQDIKDKVFVVIAKMEGDKVVVKIDKVETPVPQIGSKIKEIVNTTGRREMILDIEKDVPWGIETAILDAAKGNGVHNIINNFRK
jgi:biopolymer transport protein ExbD